MHSELEHAENCTLEDGLVFLPFPKGIKKHTLTLFQRRSQALGTILDICHLSTVFVT